MKAADLFSLNYQWKGSAFVARYLEHKAGVRYLCLIATLETALVNYDSLYLILRVRAGGETTVKRNSVASFRSIQRGAFCF